MQNQESSEITLRRSTSKLWVSRTGFEILGLSERLKVSQIQERKQKAIFARKTKCFLLGMGWKDTYSQRDVSQADQYFSLK